MSLVTVSEYKATVIDCQTVYDKAVAFIDKLVQVFKDTKQISSVFNYDELESNIADIIKTSLDHPDEMLCVVNNSPVITDYRYIASHSVNTAILTVLFCSKYPIDPLTYHDLLIATFLHDIGMASDSVTPIISKPTKLSPGEKAQLQEHVVYSVEAIRVLDSINERALNIIMEMHERRDGSGYPGKLFDKNISIQAKIAGLCDTYDSLVHTRAYRKRISPVQAINLIFNTTSKQFPVQLLQTMLAVLTVYPSGSFVSLRAPFKAMAIILKSNRVSGYRPTIMILKDPSGYFTSKNISVIELSAQLSVNFNIEGPIDPAEHQIEYPFTDEK